ncbi:parallel beta-helix domain-containing protein [Erythrobacter sanguineus]|uniref:Parallel beta-helix repeat-containing protein n=1 Tax=Erythrobacter sanguineus TaxID=198312 RepID=A0A1M7RQ42_9SPHN|nr:parallel beta-helix domain-containing protein [Erythrobacter sanguineus]SHN48394.1 parallel beta-helix repeat-containing protein [Erythrobacter sanguineus]
MIKPALVAALLASAAPVLAETHMIASGEGAQERLQEALILAEPGDEIVLEAGRYILTDGLSLDVDGVTLRGAGPAQSILDFTTQQGAGEGLLVTSDNVTLRDFALENPKGDGIKSKGADNIIYHRIRVTWTGGPKAENGAYGIYPVESTGVLVSHSDVSGASDAGIYVGQSSKITVRNSVATDNVAGIEIENSRDAIVTQNYVSRNTGGILVFDLPGLPVMGGGNVLVTNNLVAGNNTPNFAPPGNIVAGVPRGTGIMVMANERVWIEGNVVYDNPTAPFMVIAYTQEYEDARYNPYPREVVIAGNVVDDGASDPDLPGGEMLLAAFGGMLPPVIGDGLNDPKGAAPLFVDAGLAGWSLNLQRQGQALAEAQPGPLNVPAPGAAWSLDGIGAPPELEARLK